MVNKKNEKTSTEAPKETKVSKPKKGSPRQAINIFMVVVLLLIAAGIYLYQKGYVTKYYPLVKTKFSHHSPIDTTVDILTSKKAINIIKEDNGNENLKEPRAQVFLKDKTQQETIDQKETDQTLEKFRDRLKTLEEKVVTLSTALKENNKNDISVDKSFLKTLSDLQDLSVRFNQGLPFADNLKKLEKTLSADDIKALEEYASIGIPTFSLLIKEFKNTSRLLEQKERLEQSTNFFDKMKAMVMQLIHVEKVDSKQKSNDITTAVESYRSNLKKGGVKSVIEKIKELKSEDKDVLLWLKKADAYVFAHDMILKTKQMLFNQ